MSETPVKMGKIQIFTGSYKGKTTLGLGVAMRYVGQSKRVMFLGFDCRTFSSEEEAFWVRVKSITTNWNFFISEMCIGDITEIDIVPSLRRHAESLLSMAEKIMTGGKYDVLILDEINPVIALGIIPREDVYNFFNKKPVYLELILTGNNCPDDILQKADSVVEINHKKL